MSNERDLELLDLIGNVDVRFGYELRSYSGRGMCGQKCAAVELESMSNALAYMLALGLLVAEYDGQARDAEWLLTNVRHDSMGLGVVIYWPRIGGPDETEFSL